jgi:hypothetical protein
MLEMWFRLYSYHGTDEEVRIRARVVCFSFSQGHLELIL